MSQYLQASPSRAEDHRLRRRSLVRLTPSFLLALFAVACGSNSTSEAPQSVPDVSAPRVSATDAAPSPALSLQPGASFTASDTLGDKIKAIIIFGSPRTMAKTPISEVDLAGCGGSLIEMNRTMAAEMQVIAVGTSSLSEKVTFIFQSDSTVGLNFVIGYSDGLHCTQGGTGDSSYQSTLSPGQSDTVTVWVIYPNVITPNDPSPGPSVLGKGHFKLTVGLPGGLAFLSGLRGSRVSTCYGDIVPAGSLNCQS